MFWDMREPFIFNLYHGDVEGARLETILPQFDRVRHSILHSTVYFLVPSSPLPKYRKETARGLRILFQCLVYKSNLSRITYSLFFFLFF